MHDTRNSPAALADTATPVPNSIQRYTRKRRRHYILIVTVAALLVASTLLDILTGPGQYPLRDVLAALFATSEASPLVSAVLWQLRLPVALLAVMVGVSLAVAGAEMQTILDNPLADPFTLGISSAASFGAALAIVMGVGVLPVASHILIPLNAFILAMLAAMAIWWFSRMQGVAVQTMVLMGIAIMFFFNALLGLMQYVASSDSLQQLVFWSLGSLNRASWEAVALTFAALVVTLPVFISASWQLTALRLGTVQANAMGVEVGKLRLRMLLCCALLAATSVAFVGTIGFIGLVGPHIARLLVGEDQRVFLPLSALTGGLLMSVTSILSKTLLPGVIIPIGIITALIGLPFFVSLVLRTRQRGFG